MNMNKLLPIIAALLGAAVLAAGLAPTAAGKTAHGQWITVCPYTMQAPDDPIVMPGMPGMSHVHAFMGATLVDSESTTDSLLTTPSACKDHREHTAYWIPQMYNADGSEAAPLYAETYWSGAGQPAPQGMEYVVGSKLATEPQPHVTWQCSRRSKIAKSPTLDHPFDCSPYGVEAVARFELPTCWDGAGVTPEHFAYRPCRAPFTTQIVKVEARVHLGVVDPTQATLASGSIWSMHMDFLNVWEPGVQEHLIASCIAISLNCGTDKGQL